MKKITIEATARILKVPSVAAVRFFVQSDQLKQRRTWYGMTYFVEHEVHALRISLDNIGKSSMLWAQTESATERQMRKQRVRDPYDLDFTYLAKCKATHR